MANGRGKSGSRQILFSWALKSLWMVSAKMKLNMLLPWKESYDQPRQCIKSRDITLPTKVHPVKTMVFPVVMYGCEIWSVRKPSTEKLTLLNCGVEEDS